MRYRGRYEPAGYVRRRLKALFGVGGERHAAHSANMFIIPSSQLQLNLAVCLLYTRRLTFASDVSFGC